MAALETGSQSEATYLLVLEQQQLTILDLESSLLEAGSLQQLGRLLTTPEEPYLDDVTLVGWTHTDTQVGRQIDNQQVDWQTVSKTDTGGEAVIHTGS